MSFHQWHSILLFFHSLKVLYDLVSAYCISLDKLKLHTPYLHNQSVSIRDISLQNLKGKKEAAARVLLPLCRLAQGSQGTVATYAPCHHNLAPCASVRWSLVWVSYLHLPMDLLHPLSQISVYPCVKEPALSRRDPHHQSWRTEDEKVTQVLVCPHRFQLIFLTSVWPQFSLYSYAPDSLLCWNQTPYLRGNVFIETL